MAIQFFPDSGSLEPGNGDWNSLTDQSTSGWVEAGPTTTDLSELNPLSFLTVLPGDEFISGTLSTRLDHKTWRSFGIFGATDEMLGVVTYGPVLPAISIVTARSTPLILSCGLRRMAAETAPWLRG